MPNKRIRKKQEKRRLMAFLDLIDRDIEENPWRLRPFTQSEWDAVQRLLDGVEIDHDFVLHDDYRLP